MPGFGDRFQIDVLVSDLNSKPWVSSVNNITWPASVQTVLQQIAKVQTGSILLNGIGSASKWMMIIPPLPNAPMQINADTFPLSGAPLAWAPNHKYFAYIEYDPRVFTPMFVPPGIPRFTGMPDEVLFHELVHAFRILTGALGKGTLSNRR